MTNKQRWGGLYTVALMLLLVAFFVYHQVKNTGFFTPGFGQPELLALYGPIAISMLPSILRAIQGRRNPARPLEATGDLLLAIGSMRLRQVFPFDFTHIADPFPASWHFAFAWLTNDVGRFILLLQIVVGFISAIAIIATYLSIRRKEMQGIT
ncbi:MAG: hypothetical protein ACM3H7_04980 [Acidobacteriaceae bacterium]